MTRSESLFGNDQLTQLAFSLHENKGVYSLLLGSGISRAAEIPTGWEITLDLIRRVALAHGVTEQPDWAVWYRDEVGAEPNYSTVLAKLTSSPAERRSILHAYIEPMDEDRKEGRKVPTAAHRAIAELVRAGYVRVIVTTNFDRLIENALRDAGVEPTIVASPDALFGAEPLAHSACYIFKLHGDYKDARILNTNEELEAYPAAYSSLLDRIFDEYGLIVCGWSGEWDHALRAAVLRAPNRRYPVYWASCSALSPSAQQIVEHRKARVVTIADANTFFRGLQQRVETLEQTRRQNPLSVELLVSTAKRYLARPEHRIQLDELITQEATRLREAIDIPALAPHGAVNRETFLTRVRTYQGAAEALARMAGVMGRWGDGTETSLILDLIRALCVDADRVRAGVNYWLGLRRTPAVLVFMAYGLGLSVARRWSVLHDLFTAEVTTENGESKRMVDTLFLLAWQRDGSIPWNLAFETNRNTPLSDYLCRLFGEWGKSFTGLTPEFELLYERFELLGAIVYLETNELVADKHGNREWFPVGRYGWHKSNFGRLLKELGGESLRRELLAAGFARGSEPLLQLTIENIKAMTSALF
jgi:SIR2-like domain